jgi:hydrogenase-4 component F
MDLTSLTFLTLFVFIIIFLTLILAFTKSNEKITYWAILIIVLFAILILSWWTIDMALQWVLVEATTLIGAILISMSKNEKSIEVAWKFLLLNSFGLALAFLGLIILSFGIHSQISTNANEMLAQIKTHQNALVETGIWLMIFGYSAKLGLFPNHFWVSDTYSESPSQISALISALFPPTVCMALRPVVKMDYEFNTLHFSSAQALLGLGILTLLYCIWTIYQTYDIRRITAQVALFHSGGLAILLFLNPSDKVFYFALAANITVKSLLFSTMGVLRIDSGTRNLNELKSDSGINKTSAWMYFIAMGMASIIPISPFFISDMLFLKVGFTAGKFWVICIPILSIIFFLIVFQKISPILTIPSRKFLPEVEKVLRIRLVFSFLLFLISLALGIYGIYHFDKGDFFNV